MLHESSVNVATLRSGQVSKLFDESPGLLCSTLFAVTFYQCLLTALLRVTENVEGFRRCRRCLAPTMRFPLREFPLVVNADPSKTTLNFVVIDNSFITA